MGICASCCKPSSSDVITPEVEARRARLLEAADRRMKEEEFRGVKHPERLKAALEKYKKKEQKTEQLEKELATQGGPNLRWTTK